MPFIMCINKPHKHFCLIRLLSNEMSSETTRVEANQTDVFCIDDPPLTLMIRWLASVWLMRYCPPRPGQTDKRQSTQQTAPYPVPCAPSHAQGMKWESKLFICINYSEKFMIVCIYPPCLCPRRAVYTRPPVMQLWSTLQKRKFVTTRVQLHLQFEMLSSGLWFFHAALRLAGGSEEGGRGKEGKNWEGREEGGKTGPKSSWHPTSRGPGEGRGRKWWMDCRWTRRKQ